MITYLFINKVYRYILFKTKFVKSLWIRFNWTQMLFLSTFRQVSRFSLMFCNLEYDKVKEWLHDV